MKTKNGVNWKLWKRNAVVAAIVLFVCAAVYLNWSYGQGDQTAETGGKTLGEAELVSGEDGGVIDAWRRTCLPPRRRSILTLPA